MSEQKKRRRRGRAVSGTSTSLRWCRHRRGLSGLRTPSAPSTSTPSGAFSLRWVARKIRVYEVESLLSPSEGGGGEARGTSFMDHAGCCARCVCAPAKLSSVRWRPDGAGVMVGYGDYDGVVVEYEVSEGRTGTSAVFERDEHAGLDGSLVGLRRPHRPGLGRAGVGVARAGAAVCCVEFDPSGGPWVGLGSADRTSYVYDLRTMGRDATAVLEGHVHAVTYMRFAGVRARTVVTSVADETHRMWDWREGRETRYAGHANGRARRW